MKNILIFFSLLLLVACRQNDLPVITAGTTGKSAEVRLGTSDYYITIPGNLRIEEARGKEGQLGYGLYPTDSLSSMHGFIEIEKGRPIGGRNEADEMPVEYARSMLLGKTVTWSISRPKAIRFDAYAKKGGITVYTSSKYKDEVDRLIGIISTLRGNK